MFALIIVDYNTIERTIEYIELWNINVDHNYELKVVIVENGRQNEFGEILRSHFADFQVLSESINNRSICMYRRDNIKILYCETGENLGYARGNNWGALIADKIFKVDYYIISNNDLVFSEPFPVRYFHNLFLSNSQIALIGPKVIGLDGKKQSPRKKQTAFIKLIAYYWAMTWGGILKKWINDVENEKTKGICDWITGSFMIVRASCFKEVEGFDPETFLYSEELILSERLRRAGYATYYDDTFCIIHNHGETVKKTISVFKNVKISFASSYYYYKEYTNTSNIVLLIAKINFFVYKITFQIKQIVKRVIGYNNGWTQE